MKYGFYNKYDISDLIPESDKMTENYFKANIDWHIGSLVREKQDLKEAYDYYHGTLDKERFAYLKNNLGIGNPDCVEFIPLIRKHIDALVGELLREDIKPRITCRDQKTIDAIQEERRVAVLQEFIDRIIEQTQANLKNPEKPIDLISKEQIDEIRKDMESNWKSQYEISAQYILTDLLQSAEVNFKEFLRTLFTDLLVTGSCYYRVYAYRIGEDPILLAINPLDIFYNKNTNHTYIKQCNRIVHRMYMTRQEALNKYGHALSDDDKAVLFGNEIVTASGEARFVITRSQRQDTALVSNTGTTVRDTKPSWYGDDDIITVYHVEWLANNLVEMELDEELDESGDELIERFNKKKASKKIKRWRLDRYEGVRIGDYIYTMMGKSKSIIRPVDKKYRCELSYNGISYIDRNGSPFSLAISLMKLQDKYNLLHFYRDNLISSMQLPGPIIDVAAIPTFLGKSVPERLLKWMAYGKNGLYLINSAQQGQSHINTIYGGMQATLDANAVAAIDSVIASIEYTASQISGVFKERLGGIEQKDAVSNVKVGINTSFVITKQFYHLMDLMKKESLTDMINMSRITFKKGKKGSILLGHKQETFIVDPEYFTMTDYGVHISESGEELRDIETIKQLSMELVKSGSADVDLVVDMITSKSLTEIKEKTIRHIKENKNKNAKQLMEQIKQLEKELKKSQSQVSETESAKVQIEKEKLAIEKQKVQNDFNFKSMDLQIKERYNEDRIDEIKRRTEVETKEAIKGGPDKEVENIRI